MEQRIIFPRPGVVELESFELEAPPAGSVRLRSIVSLISAGTETRCLSGNFAPGTHWDGWVKYPFRPGYSTVAAVEALGPETSGLAVGEVVAVRPKHASAHNASADSCERLGEGVDPRQAVWFALAKIGFMGLLAGGEVTGRRVAVIGAGPIGQMALRWLHAAGPVALAVLDTQAARLELAAAGGADVTLAAPAGEARDALVAALGGEPEIVVDTTGNPAVFQAAQSFAARRGRVVVLGDVGDPDSQHLTSDLIIKGLSIVGAHDCHSGGDWPASRITELFFAHLRSGRFAMAGLNTHEFAPEQAPEAYALAASRAGDAMGLLFRWN